MGVFRETVDTILVEESSGPDDITGRVLARYPDARVFYYKDGGGAAILPSLARNPRKTLVLKRHRGRFVKPFPRHPWHGDGPSANLILGHGCLASCLYCFVFTYFDLPFPTLFTNVHDALNDLKHYLREHPRAWVSTGEFMDSLQLDAATGYTETVMGNLSAFPGATLELRTKHSGVEHLPADPPPGVIISFSVNPEPVVRALEPGTAGLEQRLAAAHYVRDRDYRIGLRIDPIIPVKEFADSYNGLVEAVENRLGWSRVSRVFLGALRFDFKLLQRFSRGPAARKLLAAEYVPAPDGKYRVYKHERVAMYRRLAGAIQGYAPDIKITLMMEPDYVIRSVQGAP